MFPLVKKGEITYMPANNFNFRKKKGSMKRVFIASTDKVYSSDVGRIVLKGSTAKEYILSCTDSDGLSTNYVAGFIGAVPDNTTCGDTDPAKPIYMYKIDPHLELSGKYTTANGGGHPASSDIGKYVGFYITTTTVTGLLLDMTYVSNEPGTSNANWLQITGYSTNRRRIYGYPSAASGRLWE